MSIIDIKELVVDKSLIKKVSTTIKKYNKPVLLVGGHGCGKTTLILSVAKSLKYKVINIDPDSDFKNNKRNLFFKKQIVLIDNLEEIKGEKLKSLINHFIKGDRPLFLVTSEVHKDLQAIKKKLKIRANNYRFDITKWLDYLVNKYKIKRKNVKQLVRQTGYNKGIAVNQLKLELTDLNNFKMSKKMTLWEVYENAFNKDYDRSDFYFRETSLPLFVFENYPKMKKNNIEYCNNSAAACGIIDLIETHMRHTQNYSFMPYVNIFTTEMATFDYNEIIKFPRFPKMKNKVRDNLLLETKLKK